MPAPPAGVADVGVPGPSAPSTVYLLDVNVLIALLDPMHTFHERAHTWFASTGKTAWATCPLSENGVLRIIGHASYSQGPGSPTAVAPLLSGFCQLPGHHFWPDAVSLLDAARVQAQKLASSKQLTDTYLLALAASRGGKLATLDRRLVTTAVKGGADALQVID